MLVAAAQLAQVLAFWVEPKLCLLRSLGFSGAVVVVWADRGFLLHFFEVSILFHEELVEAMDLRLMVLICLLVVLNLPEQIVG